MAGLIPIRIKQARVYRELDRNELSKIITMGQKVDVTPQDIARYEMGKEEPNEYIINTLAYVLEFPISHFYKPLIPQNTADSPLFICTNIND